MNYITAMELSQNHLFVFLRSLNSKISLTTGVSYRKGPCACHCAYPEWQEFVIQCIHSRIILSKENLLPEVSGNLNLIFFILLQEDVYSLS